MNITIVGKDFSSIKTNTTINNKCDACRIVDLLWKNKLSMQFIGETSSRPALMILTKTWLSYSFHDILPNCSSYI
jgi:hypothetical protein